MFGEKQTRTLLGPADPARTLAVPPARASAAELMNRAETVETIPVRRRRRPVLAAGLASAAAAVLAIGGYALLAPPGAAPPGDAPPGGELPLVEVGGVVVPIGYTVKTDPPPAGDHLRDLAGQLTDAPYDGESGDYAYHRYQVWGDPVQEAEGHVMGYVRMRETWAASDGSGRGSDAVLGVEYPDEAALEYWERVMGSPGAPRVQTADLPAGVLHPGTPLPGDPDQLADLLWVADGAEAMVKPLVTVYQRYVVPREVRATILEILADVPGLQWRGEVTDRAGRTGVAVSVDGPEYESVLVFDPGTGELLAHELVTQGPEPRVQVYGLILETGWTDTLG